MEQTVRSKKLRCTGDAMPPGKEQRIHGKHPPTTTPPTNQGAQHIVHRPYATHSLRFERNSVVSDPLLHTFDRPETLTGIFLALGKARPSKCKREVYFGVRTLAKICVCTSPGAYCPERRVNATPTSCVSTGVYRAYFPVRKHRYSIKY